MATLDVLFSVTVQDELGVEASVQSYAEIPDTALLSDLVTAQQAWADAIDDVTAGQLVRGHYSVNVDLPAGAKTTPDVGSRIEQTGVINFVHAGSNKRWGIAVPALKNAVLTAGKIVFTNPDVSQLTALLLAAVAGGNYTNNTFQNLTAIADAFLAFRKRRRQQRARSYETP